MGEDDSKATTTVSTFADLERKANKAQQRVRDSFREYLKLERVRKAEKALSVSEEQRWRMLRGLLNMAFSPGLKADFDDRRESLRVDTRIKVGFNLDAKFMGAFICNISEGGGFITSALCPEVGTVLSLKVWTDDKGSAIQVPVQVVSIVKCDGENVINKQGMGFSFKAVDPATRKVLDRLYETALDRE